MLRGRDQEIELAIKRLEDETSGARDECERAAENRCERERDRLLSVVTVLHATWVEAPPDRDEGAGWW